MPFDASVERLLTVCSDLCVGVVSGGWKEFASISENDPGKLSPSREELRGKEVERGIDDSRGLAPENESRCGAGIREGLARRTEASKWAG